MITPRPAAGRFAATGRRVPPGLSMIAGLAVVSLVAAVWAARVVPGSGLWLWNLDLPKIDLPLASFYHEALAAGRLPLWNDRLGLGFPLYAEGQIGAFYPPNWILFQLPPLTALDLTRVLHLTAAGVGAGLLTLRLSGSRPGSLVAALVAVLGGAITAKLEWHNLVAAYAYVPWILLPLVRRPAPTRLGLVAAGVLFGIQALAGHPNTWLLTGVAAAAILVARGPRLTGLGRAVGFGLLGAGVGAVQLIPTALLTTLSVRSTALTADDLFAAAATPFDVIGLGFQGAFARLADGHWDIFTTWYPDGVFAQFEAAAYVGLPVVALALVGIRARRVRSLVVAIAVLLAIPIVEAFRPGFLLAIPFVNGLRSPVRAYLLATLLLGVVAGTATGRPIRRSRAVVAVIGVGVVTGAYGVALGLATLLPAAYDAVVLAVTTFGSADQVAANRPLAVAALTAPWPLAAELAAGAAIVALVGVVAWRQSLRRTAGPLALAVVAAPLLLFGPAPNDTRPESDLSYAQSVFLTAVASAHPGRFVTIDGPGYYAGMPDQPAAAGLADLHMFSSLDLQASDQVADAAARDTPGAAALRRALGVDVVVTFGAPCPGRQVGSTDDPAAVICRDDAALHPPYWIPSDVARVADEPGSLVRPRLAELDPAAATSAAVAATVDARETGSLTATIDAPADGWMWVDEAWWPGWITTVDGQRVETLRALGGTLIPISRGEHRVTMALVPWDALAGLGLGLVAVFGALLWAGRRWPGSTISPWARRRSSPRASCRP